jgi:hypothetical protein
VLFVPVFFVVRYFEETRVFDSIGIWYTVIVTLVFSALLGLAIGAVTMSVRAMQTKSRVGEH